MRFAYVTNNGEFVSGEVDEFNRPVERSKWDYPYSYSGFVQERVLPNSEATGTVYTDRLLQWDYKKARDLIAKHWPKDQGDYWSNRSAAEIQNFLRDYLDKPNLQVVLVMEYCNMSSGYPVWRIDYKA
jgi:hypothetical protein